MERWRRVVLIAAGTFALSGLACGEARTGPSLVRDVDHQQLVTGGRHTCAIFAAGAVRCWGDNGSGQLGRPVGDDPLGTYSVDLGTARAATALFAGLNHTCAVLEGGAVKCWGLNSFGQLGLEDDLNRGDGAGAMGDALPTVDLGTGKRAVALALAGTSTCALLDDGGVKCWGDGYQGALGYGDTNPRGMWPGTMGNNLPVVDLGSRDGVPLKAKQLAAIEYHGFCAILDDAQGDHSGLKCWGSNDYCELGIGSRRSAIGSEPGMMGDGLQFVDIGTVASGARRRAVAMAGGFQFVCVLGDDGAVKCWGDNAGQLGIGTTGSPRSCSPDELGNAGLVTLPAPAMSVAARGLSNGAGAHACARLVTGEVTCWGENEFGQLGTGDTVALGHPSPPLQFREGFLPQTLLLGNAHSCAVSDQGRVTCWGSNEEGQIGPAEIGSRVLAPGVELSLRGARVRAVAAGGRHSCALLNGGRVKCWGENSDGQLGLGDRMNRGDQARQMGENLFPVDLAGGAIAIAAGAAHSCAVLDSGAVTCWGAGGLGQLGPEADERLLAPGLPIPVGERALAVAAGADFTCALLANGQVTCFGDNARGQLGRGDTARHVGVPAPILLESPAVSVAAGAHHVCALLQSAQVACWGANDQGQLGVAGGGATSTSTDRSRPTLVRLGAIRPRSLAAGGDVTCVVSTAGEAFCWGANDDGQLGRGDTVNRWTPPSTSLDLGTGQVAASLSVGGTFACVVLVAGQVKCWGDNRLGQLGSSLTGASSGGDAGDMGDFLGFAVQGGGRSVAALSSGGGHTCAILDTGDLRCWGDNAQGQLGAGDASPHSLTSHPTATVDLGWE